MRRSALTALALLQHAATSAFAGGDPEEGEKVFNGCKACHVVDKEQNRVGPYLVAIIGRQAGSVEGFKYSDAMKSWGGVWDQANLQAYLADPKRFIPGNNMAFAGLKKEDEVVDVIAYLKRKTVSQ